MSNHIQSVTITSVTENYVDMLLPDEPSVRRAGLAHHFDPKKTCPIGENGIALHIVVHWDGYSYSVLFDTGMTGETLLHNAEALDIELENLDHVVISHGHPDHYGGLLGLLNSRTAHLPVSIHQKAFSPRYLRLASGQVAPYYNHDLTPDSLGAAGGSLVMHDSPLEIGPGLLATGAIPRQAEFEAANTDINAPNALIQLNEGKPLPDIVEDDQALVAQVGQDGILVFVGCSHAGVINTLRYAVEITGRSKILGVFGGFHLGFPGTPTTKIDRTIEALKELDVQMLCPMHCTGMSAMMNIAEAFPQKFLLNCTGTQVTVSI